MNMLSKLVIVFAIAFICAVPKSADAKKVECPCAFEEMYKASVEQAKVVGLNNQIDACYDNGEDGIGLFTTEGAFDGGMCYTNMTLYLIEDDYCYYLMLCSEFLLNFPDMGDVTEVIFYEIHIPFVEPLPVGYTPGALPTNADEQIACRTELELIAKKSRVPCGPFIP